MDYIKAVEERHEAIRRHYQRGGWGENAPRPMCECCGDSGLKYDVRPVWSQQDEHGGAMDIQMVQVACTACPLAELLEEAMNREAAEADTSAA